MFLGPSLAECSSASLVCRSLRFVWCFRADVTGANHRAFGPCASDFSISSLALALSPCCLAGLSYPASLGLDPGPSSCPSLPPAPLISIVCLEPLDLDCPCLGSLVPSSPSLPSPRAPLIIHLHYRYRAAAATAPDISPTTTQPSLRLINCRHLLSAYSCPPTFSFLRHFLFHSCFQL